MFAGQQLEKLLAICCLDKHILVQFVFENLNGFERCVHFFIPGNLMGAFRGASWLVGTWLDIHLPLSSLAFPETELGSEAISDIPLLLVATAKGRLLPGVQGFLEVSIAIETNAQNVNDVTRNIVENNRGRSRVSHFLYWRVLSNRCARRTSTIADFRTDCNSLSVRGGCNPFVLLTL